MLARGTHSSIDAGSQHGTGFLARKDPGNLESGWRGSGIRRRGGRRLYPPF